MKRISLIYFLLCFISIGLFAQQKSSTDFKINFGSPIKECASPKGKGFSISYLQRGLKANKNDTVTIKIRAPKTSNEVYTFNKGQNNPNKLKLDCFPLIENAKITALEFEEFKLVQGNPNGFKNVNIITNAPSAKLLNPGGKEMCIQLKGAISTPGIYKFDVYTVAYVLIDGAPTASQCIIRNGFINVVK